MGLKNPLKKRAKKSKAKPRSKKAAAKQPQQTPPPVVVSGHPFAPGTEVGLHPTSAVSWERENGRAPFPEPIYIAIVADDGTLEVSGLGRGSWCAAGLVGESWRYVQFQVA
jgi:hypothetical protein